MAFVIGLIDEEERKMKRTSHTLPLAVPLILLCFLCFLCDKSYASLDNAAPYIGFDIGVPELLILIAILGTTVLPVWAWVNIAKAEFAGYKKVIWILIVFFFPILGTILYIAIGKRHKIQKAG